MVSKRRGVLVALIIGSIIGGTASATILEAAQASQSSHERAETAQVQTYERAGQQAN
jgi:type II secretory pathway component PulJ